MKLISFIGLTFLLFSTAFSQFNTEFDKNEAKNLIAICNYWLNGKIEGIDSTYIDSSYTLLYESKLYKMDNRWQLWQKDKDAIVINLRGTTRASISWLENFHAAMIPAEGTISLPDSQVVNYKFAQDSRASVHVGWAMGISFMLSDILNFIKQANQQGIYNIYITGHSQGAALAHLLRAQFEYLPESLLSRKNKFKVYAFAPPKPGNRFFAYDYASYTSLKNPSFTIINSDDWVCQVPFTIQSTDNMTSPNPLLSLENNDFDIPFFKRIFVKRMYHSLKNPVKKSQKRFKKKLGKMVHKQIEKKVGPFTTPDFRNDLSYFPVGTTIILKPNLKACNNETYAIFWQHFPAHYYQLIDEQL